MRESEQRQITLRIHASGNKRMFLFLFLAISGNQCLQFIIEMKIDLVFVLW